MGIIYSGVGWVALYHGLVADVIGYNTITDIGRPFAC